MRLGYEGVNLGFSFQVFYLSTARRHLLSGDKNVETVETRFVRARGRAAEPRHSFARLSVLLWNL
jgi:hypothetical protein